MVQSQIANGLATLALLKSQFDEGRDHIAMFLPFVLDAVQTHETDNYSVEELHDSIASRHGVTIPAHTLRTLLKRATRTEAVRREGGRYFRNRSKIPQLDIAETRRAMLSDHEDLAKAFIDDVQSPDDRPSSTDDALELLFGFIAAHHVGLVLESDALPHARTSGDLRPAQSRLVARFIRKILRTDQRLFGILQRMLEGYILQNAMFLRDIAHIEYKFNELLVILDTGIIVGALGFRGAPEERATREGLDLLRATGARLAVYDPTISEMRRILYVYRDRLGSAEGRKTLRPRAETRYFWFIRDFRGRADRTAG